MAGVVAITIWFLIATRAECDACSVFKKCTYSANCPGACVCAKPVGQPSGFCTSTSTVEIHDLEVLP